MKNVFKALGTIIFAAIVMFSFTSCDDSGGGPGARKFDPLVTWPSGLTATVGQTLSQVNLPNNAGTPGTFTWRTPGASVGDAGQRAHIMIFTPQDAAAYKTVQESVTITVTSVPAAYSLDGVWKWGSWIVTINGGSGVVTQLPSGTTGLTLDAINKGYVKVGSAFFRNLSKTGDRTWSGQTSFIVYNTSNPNAAIGTGWDDNRTFTLSADGQSFQVFDHGSSTPIYTWTRTSAANLSLDGVWKWGGWTVNINGASGLVTQFPAQTNAIGQDAVNKGYIKIGMAYIRNITKKEDGTWSCEMCEGISYYVSNPNVAIGLIINNRTITLSADGQTFQVFEQGNSTPRATWTRQ